MTLTSPRTAAQHGPLTIAQRQALYERLLAMGMPDIIAAAMAAQAASFSHVVTRSSLSNALLTFAVWRYTEEGPECWEAIESGSHNAA